MKHKENILRLRDQGKTYKEIQEILGCSKSTIAYHVGEGQKQKTKDRTNRNRTILKRKLWKYKEEKGCMDCGEKYPHWILDFDHKPEFEKTGGPTEILHKYGWDKAIKEVEKCDVVCANCHRIRTFIRGQNRYLNI